MSDHNVYDFMNIGEEEDFNVWEDILNIGNIGMPSEEAEIETKSSLEAKRKILTKERNRTSISDPRKIIELNKKIKEIEIKIQIR